jgi:hypothetical protein
MTDSPSTILGDGCVNAYTIFGQTPEGKIHRRVDPKIASRPSILTENFHESSLRVDPYSLSTLCISGSVGEAAESSSPTSAVPGWSVRNRRSEKAVPMQIPAAFQVAAPFGASGPGQ